MRFKNFNSFAFIPVEKITVGLSNQRKRFDVDEMHALSESILENGIVQPLCVRKANNSFLLISGERRLRAAKMIGLKKVPCVITSGNDRACAMLSMMENIQRKPLDCFEEAEGILKLMTMWDYPKREIATGLGLSQSLINHKLRLLKLTDWQRERIEGANLTPMHASSLVRIDDSNKRDEVLMTVIAKGLSAIDTDRYIDKVLSGNHKSDKPKRQVLVADDRLIENTLTHAVEAINKAGFKAQLKKSSEKGSDIYRISVSKEPNKNQEPTQMLLKLCAGE